MPLSAPEACPDQVANSPGVQTVSPCPLGCPVFVRDSQSTARKHAVSLEHHHAAKSEPAATNMSDISRHNWSSNGRTPDPALARVAPRRIQHADADESVMNSTGRAASAHFVRKCLAARYAASISRSVELDAALDLANISRSAALHCLCHTETSSGPIHTAPNPASSPSRPLASQTMTTDCE